MDAVKEVRAAQAALWGFYPLKRDQLINELRRCFEDSVWGPGSLPRGYVGELKVIGGIAPHAGYSYSGPCAAHLYKVIGENVRDVNTVIVLGTNHTGLGGAITTTKRYIWSTPLGDVDTDDEFINELLKINLVEEEPLAHLEEHSVEVQLPFLQFVLKSKFKLVPIVVRELNVSMLRSMAKAIKDINDKLQRNILLIASSDFTHHGSMYGYVLYTTAVAKKVRELDMLFINHILKLDTEGFIKSIREYGATVCGPGAIAILMEFVKSVGGKAKLLKYYNSAELTGQEDVAVGYASIVFTY